MSLAGITAVDHPIEELKSISRGLLNDGINGICFSAYDEGLYPFSVQW